MSDSTTNLDLISQSQAQKEVTANALFDAFSPVVTYGRRASTCIGLTWGYYGGNIVVAGEVLRISNGTITLPANSITYLEADRLTGVVSISSESPAGFSYGSNPLYVIVTGVSTVLTYTDNRAQEQGPAGTNGADGVNGADGLAGAGANAKLYYFQDVNSDLSGYSELLDAPIFNSESDDYSSVSSGTPVLLEKYVTEPLNPGATELSTGKWTFDFWAYVNSVSNGNSTLRFDVYTYTEGDSPQLHLIFSVESANLATTITHYYLDHTELTIHSIDSSARLVVMVYAKTVASTSKTVHFVHDGTTHNSQLQTPITVGSLAQPYDIGSTYNGAPTASVVLLRIPFVRKVVFPAGLHGSRGMLGVAATAQTDFDIKKNGSSFGTMRFAVSGATATFIAASQTTFSSGDVLTVTAPASPDATAADIGFCLTGTR